MKRGPYQFLRHGLRVMAPILLLLLAAEVFFWLTTESVSIDTIVRHRHAATAYMPMFFGQQFCRLHSERIRQRRPDVVTLGSSRVMRFRKEMFGEPERFYNCSRVIDTVGDLEEFIEVLPPNYTPKTILLGLDTWWFINRPDYPTRFKSRAEADDTKLVQGHISAYRRLKNALFAGKVDWSLVARALRKNDDGVPRFGLEAWSRNAFRSDGSYQAFDRTTPPDHQRDSTKPFVKGVPKAFNNRPDRVLPHLMLRCEAALQNLTRRGTKVIGFAPPFAEMAVISNKYPHSAVFVAEFREQVGAMFARNGWDFFDASDPTSLGLDDRCLEDGHHGLETYHIALLHHMAQRPAVRDALKLDPDYLERLLRDPETTPWYPPLALYHGAHSSGRRLSAETAATE